MKLFTLPVVLLFTVLPSFADSFDVFVLEFRPHGQQLVIQLKPNGNPLLHSVPNGPPFELEFFVPSFEPVLPENDVSVALFVAGQPLDPFQATFDCPVVPCGFLVAMVTPGPFKKPVNGVVTVTINGLSETFNFRYTTTTVPEPASLLLLGSGLAVTWYKHRKHRKL